MANTGKIIGALVLGAAAGTVLGILFAPNKGSVTRKKIFNGAKDIADDLKDGIKKQAEKIKDTISEVGEMAGEKFDELSKSARHRVDHHKS